MIDLVKLTALVALGVAVISGSASADTSGKKIAFPTTTPEIPGDKRC